MAGGARSIRRNLPDFRLARRFLRTPIIVRRVNRDADGVLVEAGAVVAASR